MPLPSLCPRRTSLAAACVLALLATPLAHAATASYAGSFTDDDELFSFPLILSVSQVLNAHTLSYGGGLNGQGAAVAAGGFAPVLALFDGSGLLLQSAAGSATVCDGSGGGVDPASGFCWDAGFSAALVAGDYLLVLSQDGNVPLGPYLADGYSMSGSPDYTGLVWLGVSGQRFINPDGAQRDGHWALDVSGAAIAEPATAGLLAAALVAWAATSRRRRPGWRVPCPQPSEVTPSTGEHACLPPSM